jgi:hypothetical protein
MLPLWHQACLRGWFEPWQGVHPQWMEQPEWPNWTTTVLHRSPMAMRYAFMTWCDQMALPTEPPEWLLTQNAFNEHLVVSPEQCMRSAAFIGAVCWFSQPEAIVAWPGQQSTLTPSDGEGRGELDIALLRTAARLARWHSVPVLFEWRSPVLTQEAILLQGMAWMRRVVDGHWCGWWSRLRLRCAPAMVRELEAQMLNCAGAPPNNDHKAVLMAWRQALQT